MAEIVVCRGCKRPITADGGCALCEPVKKHLDIQDDGDLSLARVSAATVRLLNDQLGQLKRKQFLTKDYDAVLAKETRMHAAAVAKIVDATRKVVQDGVEAVEAMSFQERAALFLEWFISLPPAYRSRLFTDMQAQLGPVDLAQKALPL